MKKEKWSENENDVLNKFMKFRSVHVLSLLYM